MPKRPAAPIDEPVRELRVRVAVAGSAIEQVLEAAGVAEPLEGGLGFGVPEQDVPARVGDQDAGMEHRRGLPPAVQHV